MNCISSSVKLSRTSDDRNWRRADAGVPAAGKGQKRLYAPQARMSASLIGETKHLGLPVQGHRLKYRNYTRAEIRSVSLKKHLGLRKRAEVIVFTKKRARQSQRLIILVKAS